ncbi:hypothetical protein D9619_001287 [Psilocybe cf. subviscida]|uniref:F-box domain-containing protein n=1 Tax=Psilocybe cf. subviscida TaxID=2480587 RepID=A0A8H5BI96_9AGAR|nr:hypothetical protein D9619_001287 [Psilocybe cf. subviscida]
MDDISTSCKGREGDYILSQFTNTGCRVPLNIVELVMEQLASAGSFRALRRCSLVCKDFATICQKQIFTEVVLSNGRGCQCCNRPFPALASFKKALDNKPYLGDCICALQYRHDFDWHSQLPPVLRRLRHVRSLCIWFCVWNRVVSWFEIRASFISSLLRFIRAAQITHLDLDSIYDLPAHVFALVPRLEVLKMRCITLNNDPPFFQENPLKLRALHLTHFNEQLVDTLIADRHGIVDLRALKHLDVDYMGNTPATMRVVRRLLQQSQVLDSLKLEGSLPYLDLQDTLTKHLPSKSLASLRSIELNIDLWKVEDDPYLNLTHELEKLSGRNVLENLAFSILVPMLSTCNTETSRWSELDRVLSRPSAFPRLRRVQVAVEVSYMWDHDRNKEMEGRLAVICNEAFPWLRESEQVAFDISFEISPID